MAILWPKIVSAATLARALRMVITWPFSSNFDKQRNKKLSSIFLLKILIFRPHFCSKASHGQCFTYGVKTTLKLLVHVLAIMANSYLEIVFSQKSGLNAPPPPPPPPPQKPPPPLNQATHRQNFAQFQKGRYPQNLRKFL